MSKNRICAVIGCNNINYYVYKNPDGVQKRFLRFPRTKSMCIKWIETLNRLDLYPVLEQRGCFEIWKNYRVCSDHFLEKDFTKVLPFNKQAKKRYPRLLQAAVPSQNLGNENEIYVASAPVLHLSEVEDVLEQEIENVEIKAEPLPQLPQEVEPPAEFSPFGEVIGLVRVETSIKPQNIECSPRIVKITRNDVIKHLKEKLAKTEKLVDKYRLETKLTNERLDEFDKFKNRYIDYHSVDACESKDSCTCQRDFALDLYMKSPQVYKHLQKKFLLPHTSMLYRWKLQKEQEMLHKELKLGAEP